MLSAITWNSSQETFCTALAHERVVEPVAAWTVSAASPAPAQQQQSSLNNLHQMQLVVSSSSEQAAAVSSSSMQVAVQLPCSFGVPENSPQLVCWACSMCFCGILPVLQVDCERL